MPLVEKSVLIERSAQQMFDLVDDVESYPRFLPWCSETRVDFRDERKTVAPLRLTFHRVPPHFTPETATDLPS